MLYKHMALVKVGFINEMPPRGQLRRQFLSSCFPVYLLCYSQFASIQHLILALPLNANRIRRCPSLRVGISIDPDTQNLTHSFPTQKRFSKPWLFSEHLWPTQLRRDGQMCVLKKAYITTIIAVSCFMRENIIEMLLYSI